METLEIAPELLESLELSLDALGRNMLRDVSDVLNIPYKDLLKRVYGGAGSTKICLTGPPQQEQKIISCKGIVQYYSGGFLCGVPSQEGSCFCVAHFAKPSAFNTGGATILRKLSGSVCLSEQLWANSEGIVVNKEGQIKGAVKDGVFYKYS
jgi:hypothetical protein